MAWGAVLKGVAKGVGRGARRVATDKLLNRKKKVKNRRAKAQEAMGGGEEQGGQLMIRPSTSLVPSGPSGIIPAPATDTGGGGDTSTVEGTLMTIQTKVVKVENLLKGSNAVKEKMREDARQAAKDEEDKKQEKALEKVKPKKEGKSNFKLPKAPGFFGAIWNFISTIVLGRLFMILFDHLPKLLPILKVAAVFADGFIKVVGFLGTLAMNVIDAGYKLVNGVSNWVGETFGEDVKKGFDTFLGVIKDLVAAFLVWKIWAQKAVEAAIAAVKRAFRIARVIVKRALKFAKNAIKFAKNLAAKAGKFLKNIPGVKNVVGKIGQFGGKILGAGKNLLGAGKGVAGKAAGKIGGFAAKLFGKAAKFIAPAMKSAKPFVSKFFGRIPIVGPLVVGIVSIISGDPPGQALFKTIGAALGGFLGTFIPIPVIGTLLGETIGVFVGDMLYTLLFGGGLSAVGAKLKKALLGIFNAGKAVAEWIGGGISRFIKNVLTTDPIQIPSGGGVRTVLTKGAKFLGLYDWLAGLGFAGGKDGQIDKFPNILNVVNPFKYIPLLVKSFFPPSEEGSESAPAEVAGGEQSSEMKEVTDPEEKKRILDTLKYQKERRNLIRSHGRGSAEVKALDAKRMASFSNTYDKNANTIKSVSNQASYDEDSGEITVVVPPPTPRSMGDGSGSKEVVRVPVPVGAGSDPYEDLDFFG